jgi:hypothetical protein
MYILGMGTDFIEIRQICPHFAPLVQIAFFARTQTLLLTTIFSIRTMRRIV